MGRPAHARLINEEGLLATFVRRRIALNMSQREIAESADCHENTIYRLEAGLIPNYNLLRRVLQVVGLDLQLIEVEPLDDGPIGKHHKAPFRYGN